MKKTLFAALLFFAAAAFQESAAQNTDSVSINMSSDTAAVSFITNATMANLKEIETGNLAIQKAQNADVKAFGKRMVDDHMKANEELSTILQDKKFKPSMTASPDKHGDMLKQASGSDFDKQYMSMMLMDHQKTITLFENASRNVKDPDIKAFATKTLPILQEHLTMAKTIAAKLNVSSPGTGQ